MTEAERLAAAAPWPLSRWASSDLERIGVRCLQKDPPTEAVTGGVLQNRKQYSKGKGKGRRQKAQRSLPLSTGGP